MATECKECGHVQQDGYRYCIVCGNQVADSDYIAVPHAVWVSVGPYLLMQSSGHLARARFVDPEGVLDLYPLDYNAQWHIRLVGRGWYVP